jgi:hypothetical protein
MADGQVGGNESVHWLVNADDASAVKDQPNGGGKWRQSGVDYHQNAGLGRDFRIRVKLPPVPAKRAAFLNALLAKVNGALANPGLAQLEFDLEIQRGAVASTQVQICWGKDPGWYEGLELIQPAAEEKKVRAAVSGITVAGRRVLPDGTPGSLATT